jgi:NAD(P)H-dependent flavin oxidoreductase YrpB (nitropropane dioxygenase family)
MTGPISTSLTHRLGIDHPIVQAPIGTAATPELAAAVSNAGGLGMLSLTWLSLDESRQIIRDTRRLIDRPFGINLVLEWDPSERLAIALEERVPIISFFWGDPSPWLPMIRDAGAVSMLTVGSAAEAKLSAKSGVDIIVAQGWEAGGHVWGQVASMALFPAVAQAVDPAPVIAAGGISSGQGIAAALALGAAGVWLGTRFVLSNEARVHQQYQRRLLSATETDTVWTEIFDVGWPNAYVRTLTNATFTQWRDAGAPPPGRRPGEADIIAWYADGTPVERYSSDFPMPDTTGDLDALVHYSGQGVGLIDSVEPAGEIVKTLITETVREIERLQSLVSPQRIP